MLPPSQFTSRLASRATAIRPTHVLVALGTAMLAGCGGLDVANPCTTSTVTVSVSSAIKVGQTVQAAADYGVSNCPASTVVLWSSSNSAVASITSDGRVTGASVGGPVTITATVNDKSGTADVSVTAASVVP